MTEATVRIVCKVCKNSYDPGDEKERALHEDMNPTAGCCHRCQFQPSCYMCLGSLCMCCMH